MDTHTRIKIFADRARKWAQSYAVHKKFTPDLNGLCAIASAKLFEMLDRELGLSCQLAVWHDRKTAGVHCFVICNEYIVDITATQFGNFASFEIVNRFKIDKKRYYFWNADTFIKSIEEFMMYQQETQWVPKSMVSYKILSWEPKVKEEHAYS